MNEPISSNIKKIIDEQGYKQKSIAARAGYDSVEFCNMLNNRKVMKSEDITRICLALGVTPNDLFGYKQEKGA